MSDYLRKLFLDEVEKQKEKNEDLRNAVPERYHIYFVEMEKSKKILNFEYENLEKDQELRRLGVYNNKGKAFIKLNALYFTVKGLQAQFNDWIKSTGYSYTNSLRFHKVGNQEVIEKLITVLTPNGRVIRSVSSISEIGFGGTGVDSTDPVKNAETSALGRALIQIGMGPLVFTEEDIAELKKEVEKRNTAIENSDEEESPIYKITDLKPYKKDGASLLKLTVAEEETGACEEIWLRDSLVEQAKSIGLKVGDSVRGILGNFPGKNPGEIINTFNSFLKVS